MKQYGKESDVWDESSPPARGRGLKHGEGLAVNFRT